MTDSGADVGAGGSGRVPHRTHFLYNSYLLTIYSVIPTVTLFTLYVLFYVFFYILTTTIAPFT